MIRRTAPFARPTDQEFLSEPGGGPAGAPAARAYQGPVQASPPGSGPERAVFMEDATGPSRQEFMRRRQLAARKAAKTRRLLRLAREMQRP